MLGLWWKLVTLNLPVFPTKSYSVFLSEPQTLREITLFKPLLAMISVSWIKWTLSSTWIQLMVPLICSVSMRSLPMPKLQLERQAPWNSHSSWIICCPKQTCWPKASSSWKYTQESCCLVPQSTVFWNVTFWTTFPQKHASGMTLKAHLTQKWQLQLQKHYLSNTHKFQ